MKPKYKLGRCTAHGEAGCKICKVAKPTPKEELAALLKEAEEIGCPFAIEGLRKKLAAL